MAWPEARTGGVNAIDRSCRRIAAALQTLAEEEALAVRAGDFATIEDAQRRAVPLLEFLSVYAGSCREAHTALAAVYKLRRESDNALAIKLASVREALRELGLARSRLSRIAPAYTASTSSNSRLLAVG